MNNDVRLHPANLANMTTYTVLLITVEVRNLSFVHVEIVDDDTNEQVESEKRPEDYEENKIQVHQRLLVEFRLIIRLQ